MTDQDPEEDEAFPEPRSSGSVLPLVESQRPTMPAPGYTARLAKVMNFRPDPKEWEDRYVNPHHGSFCTLGPHHLGTCKQ